MDSNAYSEGNIANGEMDPSRLSWLSELLNQMQTTGLSQGQEFLSPAECAEAIKCLVIHHHVCDLSFGKRYFNLGRSFTRMNGSERLLKLISGKVQVVMHGHERAIVRRARGAGAPVIVLDANILLYAYDSASLKARKSPRLG